MTDSQNGELVQHQQSRMSSLMVNRWSFYALILYFAVQPFNDFLHGIVLVGSFIDLAWVVLLLALAVNLANERKVRLGGSFEMTVVIIWTLYLTICIIFANNERKMEPGLPSQAAYNLRWLLQSVPIFVIVVVRGLTKSELNAILTTIVLMTPLSIFAAYRQLGMNSMADMQSLANNGQGVSYNLFVPYTTFPLFAAIYLLTQFKSKLLKVPIICSLVLITLFIFINPSRQSVMFVLAGVLIAFVISGTWKHFVLISVIVLIVGFSIYNLDLTDRVVMRFFSSELLETSRTEQMAKGLAEMNGLWEWLFGRGLDIVFEDGVNPHNNYIFSIMRTGLLGMVLMFLPFFNATFTLIKYLRIYGRRSWFDRNIASFVMITMLFVLYHSFFGYPHLDALNGPIVWFGLAVWVIYNRDLQNRALFERNALKFSCGSDDSRIM